MMKSLYNYILLAVMAFATVGCLGELNTDIPSAESGDEVQFGLSLPSSMTRTTYGDKNGTGYPIYWVDGDKVQVYSPQCLDGRNDAEYKVSVESSNQNYATSLTPTGASGVQWGDQPAMFYSVYPSGKYTISDDGATIQNLRINFSDEFEVTHGEQGSNVVTPKGADCLMFAKTPAPVDPRTQVNLSYSPMATSVIITLQGPSTDSEVQNITIQSIKLIAPSGTFIAGSFNVKFDDKSGKYVHTGWVDGAEKSNIITVQVYDKATSAFHVIEGGETLQIPIFLAPIAGLAIQEGTDENTIDDDWRIEVLVQAQITELDVYNNEVTKDVIKTFTKKLKFAEGFNADLEPGMVHELPALPTLDIKTESSSEWNPGDWMVHVPRNVYLSEVSIPGSWNSLNSEFQGTNPSISTQYNNGVRAFHLDTRWKRSGRYGSYTYALGTANGGNTSEVVSDGRVMIDSDNPTFLESLTEITSNVKDDEYMVLICTFAQASYNYTDSNNGTWIDAISTTCAANTTVYDAKKLTSDTLVGDVLGKVIVIINTEGAIASVPSDSKCLFINIPMKLISDQFGTALNDNNIGEINKGTANSTAISDTGIDMYNSQAQVCIAGETYTNSRDRSNVDGRGFAPTFGERKTVANNILSWSKANYGTENYSHDKWIYLGLGGYYVHYARGTGLDYFVEEWRATETGHEDVASDLNTWINGKVTEMGTIPTGQTVKVPYYPVGIVLMNFVNDYASTTVKNILLLNNEYRLQYDPNKPSDYNPNATTKSAAPSYSSGMNDSDVAAFGWD